MFRAVNIGSSMKIVRDKHMVNMKHYWEVESAKNLTLDDLKRSFQRHESEKRQYLCERQSNRIIKILKVDAGRATVLCEQCELKLT